MSICISTIVVHMRLRVGWRIFAVLFSRMICDLRRTELFIHGDDVPLGLIQKWEHMVLNGVNPSKTHFAIGNNLMYGGSRCSLYR